MYSKKLEKDCFVLFISCIVFHNNLFNVLLHHNFGPEKCTQ